MLSFFFQDQQIRAKPLIRFDIEDIHYNKQKPMYPLNVMLESYACYDHGSKKWIKLMFGEGPDSATSQGLLPDDVKTTDHTFFNILGFMWHLWTDDRFKRRVRTHCLHYCILQAEKAYPDHDGYCEEGAQLIAFLRNVGRNPIPLASNPKRFQLYPM